MWVYEDNTRRTGAALDGWSRLAERGGVAGFRDSEEDGRQTDGAERTGDQQLQLGRPYMVQDGPSEWKPNDPKRWCHKKHKLTYAKVSILISGK